MSEQAAQPQPTTAGKCLVTGCDRKGDDSRGMCSACYANAARLVRNGKTTWKSLERRGLALKSKRPVRPNLIAALVAKSSNK